VKPLHVGDGKEEPALSYLKWVEDRVRFLSAVCPEQVLLEQLVGAEEAKDSASDNKLAKANLIARLEKDGHPTDAQALKVHVGYILPNGGRGNPYIEKLVLTLRDIIKFDVESRVVKK
jgi:hypothetical protein